jgi:3-methyladenine DNA glycosylase AlkC
MNIQLRTVFNTKNIKDMGGRLKEVYPKFDQKSFFAESTLNINDLNYQERIDQITDALRKHLPEKYEDAVDVIIKALPPEIRDDKLEGFEGFINLPYCRYVSRYGIDSFDISMNALKELTKRFTSEYDIRFFIMKYPERCLELFKEWAKDENLHVRRLVSEGTRPRLPLGKRLQIFVKDPTPVIPLLDILKDDPILYIRRSVANHINDITKDNPDIAVKTVSRWLENENENIRWIASHSMRTLLKQGNSGALSIMGYPKPDNIDVWGLDIKNTCLSLGDDLEFSFVIDNRNESERKLMVDF